MSDTVWAALIGSIGTIVGAAATIIVARTQAAQKEARNLAQTASETAEATPILGELIDLRELRILRALYGEKKGRILETYQSDYYRSALSTIVKKGWAKKLDGRFYMTAKGADLCRAYFKQLLDTWEPTKHVLS